MRDFMDAGAQRRLISFFDRIGSMLGNSSRRSSFANYCLGLLGDGERKSIEPMAARACVDPQRTEAAHQKLHHFVSDSCWDDSAVRREASHYVIDAMCSRGEAIETWIIDDTGFLKQGAHSVGVQRQYTGSAGKVTNCQIGVSLTVATATEHAPIDFALYLPPTWLDDAARRKEARIPEDVCFKTKPELALSMIEQAKAASIPDGVVLADAAYGTSRAFRDGIRKLGLHYAVGVDPKTSVFVLDAAGQPLGEPASVRELAEAIEAQDGFRRCSWRQGTSATLTARFALRSVVPAYDYRRSGTSTATGLAQRREHLSLLIEWRDGEPAPANYFLISFPVRTIKATVRVVMQRWRTERVYEDLKGELGLDHFEGRRFRGWHHHVSVALCCFAFVVAERMQRFSPSTRSAASRRTQSRAA
jgi:SRSO17 transposase